MATLIEEEVAADFSASLAGDTAIYRQFLLKITPVLRGIIKSKLPSFDSASVEDVLQEALLAIHAKRHTWNQEQPVLPWLYAITRYKSIDALRAQQRSHLGNSVDIDDMEGLAAPVDGTEQQMDVESAVSSLSGKVAQVVRCIGMEGKSIENTSKQLEMSENSVRVAFHRGLKQLVGLRGQLTGEAE